jgi:hypothetical protein
VEATFGLGVSLASQNRDARDRHGVIEEEVMKHAGVYVVASVGLVTMACACASRQSGDGSKAVAHSRSSSEATNTAASASTAAESGAVESGGAGESDDDLTPASGPRAPRVEPASDCPMQIRGARLSALPAMNGVALLFTTQNQPMLDELRRRALALHDAYARGVGPSAGTANDPTARAEIETSADYVDERDGARVEVRAIHQNDVDELRRRLRTDVRAMTDERVCPALGASDAAAPGATSP